MKNPLHGDKTEALPGPYSLPPPREGVRPTPATLNLVRSQVRALLEGSKSFRQIPLPQRRQLAHNLVKIGAYTAALMHEDFHLSKQLGQTPVLRQQEEILAPIRQAMASDSAPPSPRFAQAAAAAEEFSPRAASQVARITRQTLNAIAFPTFVADLIKGSFRAIVDASIQQMEAYGELLANVAKTVDQFMADNITDNQARDYLSQNYPAHFTLSTENEAPRISVREGADDQPPPDFQHDLELPESFTDLDDDAVEEVLVPAARRKLARMRHQLLATMVLMGINRIVITSGRIRAQMGFHIDASDTGRAEFASDFDWKNETEVSTGGGVLGFLTGSPKYRTKNSITYVRSTKKESSDDLNVEADLTGEVDLKFKSDYFPLQRFADAGTISLIQGATPNPSANTPNTGSGSQDDAESNKKPVGAV